MLVLDFVSTFGFFSWWEDYSNLRLTCIVRHLDMFATWFSYSTATILNRKFRILLGLRLDRNVSNENDTLIGLRFIKLGLGHILCANELLRCTCRNTFSSSEERINLPRIFASAFVTLLLKCFQLCDIFAVNRNRTEYGKS